MKRRDFLQSAALCGAAAMRPPALKTMLQTLSGSQPTLKSLASSKGITIGGQVETYLLRQPGVADFVAQNCGIITPGMALKWETIRKTPNQFNFADADQVMSFARSHGLQVHGHNLCWDVSNPPWLVQSITKDNAKSILENHIQTVVGRYRGQIASWDVVNEPIHGNKRPDFFNPGPWLDTLGESYIDIAFHAAAAVDPKALLMLNIDYVEQTPGNQWRDANIALIKRLKSRGVPVQGIGIESHLTTKAPVQNAGRDAFIRELRSMGLQVIVTELDVDYAGTAPDPQTRLNTVASYYHDYLVNVIQTGKVSTVIFWTLVDRGGVAQTADNSSVAKFTGLVRAAATSGPTVENPALTAIRSALSQISPVA